jgi:predicted nicotinamide N-methyase
VKNLRVHGQVTPEFCQAQAVPDGTFFARYAGQQMSVVTSNTALALASGAAFVAIVAGQSARWTQRIRLLAQRLLAAHS